MKVLIAGGAGFLGNALTKSLLADKHEVYLLSREDVPKVPAGAKAVKWDGKTTDVWGSLVNDMDVVVHLAGKTLASWPWTGKKRRAFIDSRVIPGRALVEAIQKATQRPRVFVQQSGINYYGLHGDLADESTPPADDFSAQVAQHYENSTRSVDELGIRRIITRSGVVLARRGGLMALMALPVKLFVGGPVGRGTQAMPWIHLDDWVAAVRFLIDDENARGAYNLVAPIPTSNAEFYRSLAKVLHRPYWFPAPAFLLGTVLGEMGVFILEGRFSQPKRLTESGFRFQFPGPREAFLDLYR